MLFVVQHNMLNLEMVQIQYMYGLMILQEILEMHQLPSL